MINIDFVTNKNNKKHQNTYHCCFNIWKNKLFIKYNKVYLYTKDKYI